MAAEGPDWLTSPRTQIRWGEDYIEGQYGTPCQAWAYWQVAQELLTSRAAARPVLGVLC